jgi:hypothetical protein
VMVMYTSLATPRLGMGSVVSTPNLLVVITSGTGVFRLVVQKWRREFAGFFNQNLHGSTCMRGFSSQFLDNQPVKLVHKNLISKVGAGNEVWTVVTTIQWSKSKLENLGTRLGTVDYSCFCMTQVIPFSL